MSGRAAKRARRVAFDSFVASMAAQPSANSDRIDPVTRPIERHVKMALGWQCPRSRSIPGSGVWCEWCGYGTCHLKA